MLCGLLQSAHVLLPELAFLSGFFNIELVAKVLTSSGPLWNGRNFPDLFPAWRLLLPSACPLCAGSEDKVGSQAMSASLTTNFTNSEKGGKTPFSSFQLKATRFHRLLAHLGNFDASFRFSWSSSRTRKLPLVFISCSH